MSCGESGADLTGSNRSSSRNRGGRIGLRCRSEAFCVTMNLSKSSRVKSHLAKHYTGVLPRTSIRTRSYNTNMRWIRIVAGFLFHRLRSLTHPPPAPLKEGVAAPDFDLPDQSGHRHRLKDYAGRKVILWFYLRARTPG